MAHLPPTRRLRRRERARRRQFLVGAILTAVLLAASVLHLSRVPPPVGEARAVPANGPFVLTTVALEEGGQVDPERTPFPYSIIKGGAQSAEALQAAIDADPVVREHYTNFDVGRTRVVRLAQSRVAHVSYRIGNDVFWTKRALLLKAGETILTDGTHYARTRCGNQIAMSPGRVSPLEPAAEVLNPPLAARVNGAFAAFPLSGPGNPANTGLMAGGDGGGSGGALFPGVGFPSGGSIGSIGASGGTGAGGGSAIIDDPATGGGDPNGNSGVPGTPYPPNGNGGSTPNGSNPNGSNPNGSPNGPPPNGPPNGSNPNGPPGGPNGEDPPPSSTPPTRDDVKQIPEPAVLLLVGAGGAALFRQMRSRKRAS